MALIPKKIKLKYTFNTNSVCLYLVFKWTLHMSIMLAQKNLWVEESLYIKWCSPELTNDFFLLTKTDQSLWFIPVEWRALWFNACLLPKHMCLLELLLHVLRHTDNVKSHKNQTKHFPQTSCTCGVQFCNIQESFARYVASCCISKAASLLLTERLITADGGCGKESPFSSGMVSLRGCSCYRGWSYAKRIQ